MAARTAWVLNLDADVELAAIASGAARATYTPTRRVQTAMRAFVPGVAASLLAPGDIIVDDETPPLAARGLVGRAFCPTPRALRLLRRVGAEPEAHPACDVLLRVNARAFASSLGATLPGAAFVTDEEAALAMLATSPHHAAWRVKRNYGMTGRGQRVLTASPSDNDRAFIRAGIAEGGVQIEPNVAILRELAIHGVLAQSGAVAIGPVVEQRCDARGAWLSSARIAPEDAPSELAIEAARVASALHAAGYFGPFGVDAFTYRLASGAIALQPRSEINARYTMGFATSGLHEP